MKLYFVILSQGENLKKKTKNKTKLGSLSVKDFFRKKNKFVNAAIQSVLIFTKDIY